MSIYVPYSTFRYCNVVQCNAMYACTYECISSDNIHFYVHTPALRKNPDITTLIFQFLPTFYPAKLNTQVLVWWKSFLSKPCHRTIFCNEGSKQKRHTPTLIRSTSIPKKYEPTPYQKAFRQQTDYDVQKPSCTQTWKRSGPGRVWSLPENKSLLARWAQKPIITRMKTALIGVINTNYQSWGSSREVK